MQDLGLLVNRKPNNLCVSHSARAWYYFWKERAELKLKGTQDGHGGHRGIWFQVWVQETLSWAQAGWAPVGQTGLGRTWILGLLNQQKLIRGQPRNSGKALLGPLLQQEEWKQATGSLAHSPAHSLRRGRLVPYRGWGEGRVQESGQRSGLGGLPTPLVVVLQGACIVPAFALSSSEVAVGLLRFWGFFYILLPIVCSIFSCTQLFLVPYSFFVFCCSRRGLSRCKHWSHYSKGSQLPGPSLHRRNTE